MKIGSFSDIRPFFGDKSGETKKAQIKSGNNDNHSDQLCISKEARKFHAGETLDSEISAHNMKASHEHLNAVKRRVERGYYGRPQIIAKIAEKLIEDDEIVKEYSQSRQLLSGENE